MRPIAAVLSCLLTACPLAARAQETVEARETAKANVRAGLRWLAGEQGRDGSWGSKDKLALTGMSGLALLASGSTPQRGPYAGNIRTAIDFVLQSQQRDGRAFIHPSSGYSAIHNHGYALLFLTQAYGEGGALDKKLRYAISQGIQATIRSQFRSGKSDGGFGYFLYRKEPPGNTMWKDDEGSTTISQIQALRGARNAGFKVERRALERAEKYIASSQHPSTGGFVYSVGSYRVSFVDGSNRPTFAITAACTAVLHALGSYKGPQLEAGIKYVEAFIPPSRKQPKFYYYAHYYAAQVMHMLGGPRGTRWMKAIRAELASRQSAKGYWPADPEDTLAKQNSAILNTAWSLQILLLDRGVLPIHER